MIELTRYTGPILAAVLAVSGAAAQETAAPAETEAPPAEEAAPAQGAPGTGLSLGREVSDVGRPYTRETFEAWELRCVRTEDGKKEPCQIYQLLKDAEGVSVAEITMVNLPEGGQAVAGATIITPLETLLTEAVTIAVDGGSTKRYPFTFCAAVGCVARVGFTAPEVESFKKGAKATLSIVPLGAPGERVNLDISLKGFTAAFEAVQAATAAAAAE
jgi:invasion protein IalB